MAALASATGADFALTDVKQQGGETLDFRGKHVVLEWITPVARSCKTHNSNNMQSLQKGCNGKTKMVWLSVNSTNKTYGLP